MLSPEDQQVKIRRIESNLENIRNDLVLQHSALPALESENEKQYREALAAVHAAHAVNNDTEKLKLESIRLTAKRQQLMNQCEDLTKCINEAREDRNDLENLLKEEDKEIDQQIGRYEASLKEMAERFRETRIFYNESEMKNEYEIINQNIVRLELEQKRNEKILKGLQKEFNSLVPNVPNDILAIVGKNELDDKLKQVTDQCAAALREKRQVLLQ